jgi:hypothetical protein
MGLGVLLPIGVIVTTFILVLMTEAPTGVKATAGVICICTLVLPRFFSSLGIAAALVQVGLSILIILYLKFQGYVD